MSNRSGALVVDLYTPDGLVASSRVASWQNDLGQCTTLALGPVAGSPMDTRNFIGVQISPLSHLPGDWVLGQGMLNLNQTNFGLQPVLFRFADQPDTVPTGVFTARVPFFGKDGWTVEKTETWWVTIRGSGSEQRP